MNGATDVAYNGAYILGSGSGGLCATSETSSEWGRSRGSFQATISDPLLSIELIFNIVIWELKEQKLILGIKIYYKYQMSSLKPEPTVFPEDIQCIVDPVNARGGIFISNVEAASNLLTLKKYSIKAVLTAAFNLNIAHPKNDVPYYKKVPGEDHERFDLSKYFDESVEFIQNAIQTTNVLVHCMAGVSRSVSLVLAFLIKAKGMSFDQAYKLVKNRRKIIYPNDGFIQQLKNYQKTCKLSSTARNYESPAKTSARLSEQLKHILSKYESPLKTLTPTKYELPSKMYETVKTKLSQSPTKIQHRPELYESPRRRTQFSPLKTFNMYESPTRKTYTTELTKRYSHKQKGYENEEQIERRISQIRKKYSDKASDPPAYHGRTKSYLDTSDFLQTRKYSQLSTNCNSPSKLLTRKLQSYYDRL